MFHVWENKADNLRDLLAVSDESIIGDGGVLPSLSNIVHIALFATTKLDSRSVSRQTLHIWDYRQKDTDKLMQLLMETTGQTTDK